MPKPISRAGSDEKGFTLAEVAVSCLLIAMIFLPFADIMYIQQRSIAYSRHKIQAVHALRTILEMQRTMGFSLINGNQQFSPPAYVGCTLPGATVTLKVIAPYNDTACVYRKTVQAKITWNESEHGAPSLKQESLTTDIANEAQLN
ncbi:MAG: hypothetical protein HQL28_04715 [Candidatus Omnitrophica bacterium]|nr:hypothetical protein [Candidatus Omnitrophota bacterium]